MKNQINSSLVCREAVDNKSVIGIQIIWALIAFSFLLYIGHLFLQERHIFLWIYKISLTLYFLVVLQLFSLVKKLFATKGEVILICEKDGIWLKHFGHISWNDIAQIDEFKPISYIEELKSPGIMFLKKPVHAGFYGTMQLLFAKAFTKNYVVLPPLDVPFFEVKHFVNEHKK